MNDIPFECQEFVLKLDKYLMGKGSMRTIKSAKSGFVTFLVRIYQMIIKKIPNEE